MNPDQFKKHLNAVQIQIKTFAKKDAPRIAGKVAIDHFKENFQNEAFEKKKWKEVKRRINIKEQNNKKNTNRTRRPWSLNRKCKIF